MYIETEGKNLEIGINPKYFLDALKVIEDEEVFIEFGSNISPCIIKPIEEMENKYITSKNERVKKCIYKK